MNRTADSTRFKRSKLQNTRFQPEPYLIWHEKQAVYYENPRNQFCLFRKTFHLPEKPVCSQVNIMADTKYILYINRHYTGRGPSRFDPRWTYYDSYDVNKFLQKGDNVIAVMVLFHGYGSGAQASIMQSLLYHSFIDTANGKRQYVISDNSWRAFLPDAWDSNAPRLNGRQGPMEVFDTRKMPANWTGLSFNDNNWSFCKPVRGGLHNSAWQNLQVRDIPHLEEGKVDFQAVTATGTSVGKAPPVNDLGKIRTAMQWNQTKHKRPHNIIPGYGMNKASVMNIDFKKVYAGYFGCEINAQAGTIIDVLYAEELWHKLVPQPNDSKVACDRFICKNGKNHLEISFGWKAFRYAQLWVWSKEDVKINNIYIKTIGYPVKEIDLHSGDNKLNRIINITEHSLRLCMQDGFLDSSSREQQQWMGDGARDGVTAAWIYGDTRLWKRLLTQIGQSQRANGALLARHPGRHENIAPIPLFMLDWITSIWEYYTFTGDIAFIKEWWPNMVLVLRWFSAFEGKDALLKDVIHWMHIDWGELPKGPEIDSYRGGIVTALNIKYAGSLDVMAKIADIINDQQAKLYYSRTATKVKKSITAAAFDKRNQSFVDNVVNGKKSKSISEPTNSMALNYLDIPKTQAQKLIDNVFLKGKSLHGSPCFLLDTGRALGKFGYTSEALSIFKQRFTPMLNAGATSCWECWGLFLNNSKPPIILSASHGWGSGFLSFLVEYVLGITITRPGFKSVDIKPSLIVKDMSAHIFTPAGKLKIQWHKTQEKYQFSIEKPPHLKGRLLLPGKKPFSLKSTKLII
jgi:alpha-L-rhamnosidase